MSDKQFQRKLERLKKQGERQKAEWEILNDYAKYIPEKKKTKVSNIMLFVIVFAIIAYTIASFWLTYTTGACIDSTLTTCFYAFWGSEIIALTGIKISKVKHNFENLSDNYDCPEENNE